MNIQKEIADGIRDHAKSVPNEECCGLIVKNDKNFSIVKCFNASPEPEKTFLINARDFLKAKSENDEILASYHSHPKNSHEFSELDKISAEDSGLPMWVYSIPTDQFAFYTPKGIDLPLEGRPFAWGITDCYALVQDYYRKILHINLLQEFSEIKRSCPKDVSDGNFFELNYLKNGFEKIIDKPRKHDVIMMRIGAKVVNHVGVYLGNDIMLHHPANRLSCKTLYGSHWKKMTAFFVRHKDLYGKG